MIWTFKGNRKFRIFFKPNLIMYMILYYILIIGRRKNSKDSNIKYAIHSQVFLKKHYITYFRT